MTLSELLYVTIVHSRRAIKSALNEMKPECLERVHLTLGEPGGAPDVWPYETSPVAFLLVVDCLMPSSLYRPKNGSTVRQGRKIPPFFFTRHECADQRTCRLNHLLIMIFCNHLHSVIIKKYVL